MYKLQNIESIFDKKYQVIFVSLAKYQLDIMTVKYQIDFHTWVLAEPIDNNNGGIAGWITMYGQLLLSHG